jgi:hypothetical protein
VDTLPLVEYPSADGTVVRVMDCSHFYSDGKPSSSIFPLIRRPGDSSCRPYCVPSNFLVDSPQNNIGRSDNDRIQFAQVILPNFLGRFARQKGDVNKSKM